MRRLALLAALLLAPALASAQGAIGVASGGSGAIPECSGAQAAFGVCLDTATGDLIWEGATADGFESTLTITDPTADHTFTLPNVASGTFAFIDTASTQTWSTSPVFAAALGMQFTGTIGARFTDSSRLQFGTGQDLQMIWTTVTTPDTFQFRVLASGSQSINLVDHLDLNYDFQNCDAGTGNYPDPAFVWHSANQSTTECGWLTHDQTDFIVGTLTGGVRVDAPSGLILEDAGTRPTCAAGVRGALFFENGGAGADSIAVCCFNGSTYNWQTMTTCGT